MKTVITTNTNKEETMYAVTGVMTGEIIETFIDESEAEGFCEACRDDFPYDIWTVEMV